MDKTKAKNMMKKKASNLLMTVLAVGAAGVAGYLGWTYFAKRRRAKASSAIDVSALLPAAGAYAGSVTTTPVPQSAPQNTSAIPRLPSNILPSVTTSPFPLKLGSKGDKVKALQRALIEKYGAQTLPRYKDDGAFGTEVVNALKKVGLPATVSESLFNVLVKGSAADTSNIGSRVFDAAQQKNFTLVLSLLKAIGNKNDYQAASSQFSENRLDNGVRQTLVTGLLNRFTSDSQKQALRYEFLRMGLQYNGDKWSLSGIGGRPIVTVENATVWSNRNESRVIPAGTVLGNELSRRLSFTCFENQGRPFLVQTRSIKYLTQ